jgi:A/G-specific adenine glycosylase
LGRKEILSFRRTIYGHFREQGRTFPWRDTRDPYAILVSEFMLQQTGTQRVLLKYGPFLQQFPDFAALAAAPLQEVLAAWQGLGYNRRALALKRLARQVAAEHGGRLPRDEAVLRTLPGIGPATAGALAAFAFNRPAVFLETNIRRVFLHFFFAGCNGVKDGQILPLAGQTLDRRRPRMWYSALMDYGAWLKAQGPNPNQRSRHYARQGPFAGSDRELRGLILKTLLAHAPLTCEDLVRLVGREPARVRRQVALLEAEGFLDRREAHLRIASQ